MDLRDPNQEKKKPEGRDSSRVPFDDRRAVALARWVISRRWLVIATAIVAAAGAASGIRDLGFASEYRIFFGERNPQLAAFETLQRIYSKDDNVSFVLRPASGDVFSPGMLAAIGALTEASWRIPYATRVDSLTNFQHSFAAGDDLTVRDLVWNLDALDPAAIAAIREVALFEPLLVDRVVSPDGTTTSVNITLTLPQKDELEIVEVMERTRRLAEEFGAENPGVRVAITGVAPLSHAFSEASQRDMETLLPLMYAALLVVMIALLRSLSASFVALVVIGFSAAAAMGFAGWVGIPLTPPSAIAPTIILTIAIADSIHLLITMLRAMRRGSSKTEAIVESVRINFAPVLLTSVTTIIGFSSLNFSDSPPFNHLGNITAVGVAAAWAFSIFFLPALIAVLPLRVGTRTPPSETPERRTAMDRIADYVIARPIPLLIAMTGLAVGLSAMIPRIALNDQFVKYFDPEIPFRADSDFASKHLAGMYQINWSLGAGESGGISDPDYLRRVHGFVTWLRGRAGVAHVLSLTDVLARLNKNLHGDDSAWYRLPDSRELAAQYLLLFEMSLPYGLDLNNQINVDKSALRVIVTSENISTSELRLLEGEASAWLAAHLPEAAASPPTSAFVMFAYISKRNIESMLGGSIFAFLLISLTLGLALRNLKLGLASLVPNLIPVAMAFGVWSLFVGEIGLASSVVTATSLGIIVDATVHYLSKYRRARREHGADAAGAVR